uniref:Putative ovule protein n=1 Tax=Solanum chacoense TaxID=4108 RepID=A0A0V0GHA1_SOLCH
MATLILRGWIFRQSSSKSIEKGHLQIRVFFSVARTLQKCRQVRVGSFQNCAFLEDRTWARQHF